MDYTDNLQSGLPLGLAFGMAMQIRMTPVFGKLRLILSLSRQFLKFTQRLCSIALPIGNLLNQFFFMKIYYINHYHCPMRLIILCSLTALLKNWLIKCCQMQKLVIFSYEPVLYVIGGSQSLRRGLTAYHYGSTHEGIIAELMQCCNSIVCIKLIKSEEAAPLTSEGCFSFKSHILSPFELEFTFIA